MHRLLQWGIILFIMYAFIPGLFILTFGLGTFRKGRAENEIALTFDDGPNPIFTPLLLDLLRKYQVKATFFVVGSKAEKYEKIISRMHKEGHLIGIHNYVHHTNLFMSSAKVKQQLDHSADIIERITKVRPIFYRPPWGLLNLFDLKLREHFQIILWSLMVGDWRSRGGKEKIKNKLIDGIKGGDVIVLHDCGETFGANADAPYNMLEALQEVLKELTAQGYTFVRIDEMINMEENHISPVSP